MVAMENLFRFLFDLSSLRCTIWTFNSSHIAGLGALYGLSILNA